MQAIREREKRRFIILLDFHFSFGTYLSMWRMKHKIKESKTQQKNKYIYIYLHKLFKVQMGVWGQKKEESSLKRESIPIQKKKKTKAKGRRATSYLRNSGLVLQTQPRNCCSCWWHISWDAYTFPAAPWNTWGLCECSAIWPQIIIPGALDGVDSFKIQLNNRLSVIQQTHHLTFISFFPIFRKDSVLYPVRLTRLNIYIPRTLLTALCSYSG